MSRSALALALLAAIASCRRPSAQVADAAPKKDARTIVYRSHVTMGTQVTLTAYTADEPAALAAFDESFAEFDRLDRLLTVWRDSSEISQINQKAGVGPVQVSAETLGLLERAREISVLTRGKFDVTFAALSGLWKFDHDMDGSIPPHDAIASRLALIDYRELELDPVRNTAFLKRAGMKVHLGGIGKGYGVDRAVAILRKRGLVDFTVQAGGDFYAAGHHGDRPWRIGIRDPRGPPDSYFAACEVSDATFSTSGDYERAFVQAGKRYHHILDPATGEPARASRSVTIMAPDATTADAISKGVFILGAEAGMKLIDQVAGAGAVIVDAQNQVHVSSRLKDRVKILRPPTDGI